MRIALTALALATLLGCGGATVPVQAPSARVEIENDPQPTGRLPESATPTHYTLALQIVPSEERFSGEVSIDVELTALRDVIWLHGEEMNVTHVHASRDGQPDVAATFERVDEDGLARVRLATPMSPGALTLHVAYDAPFNRTLHGLYRADAGGEAYAFTQFESIAARLAFPCFDEPAFKTPFDVTLTVRSEHVAIANTRVVEETALPGGLKRLRFATTEKLPTYLIAFAVGNLDVVEAPAIAPTAVREHPLPFRGVAVHGRGGDLAYALEHTPRYVEELERYFGIAYPYDKLDIIAVPDFAAGAMENAGAITFRETLLLVDPRTASEDQRRYFAYTMAHELAHQWFGNLVTMPWWDDIWLNEAFATWMQYRIIDRTNPEYAPSLSFRERAFNVMGADSLENARQIRQPIESTHDILNAFDGITYTKGGAVIAMFERYVGEGTFQRGIHAYLEEHRFGSATATDFLSAITSMAGRDVATPFSTFLNQPGVPLVSVELSCTPESRRIVARQTRYLPMGSTASAAEAWQIPFCVRYETGREPHEACALLNHAEEHLSLPESDCPTFIVPNADGAGYYRTEMTSADLRNLREHGWSHLRPSEKLALVDSVRSSFVANRLSARDYLDSLQTFAHDDTRQVAVVPMGTLASIRDWMDDDAARARVEAFGQRLYRPLYDRLGWQHQRRDSNETRSLRADVVRFMALTARLPAARRDAMQRGRAILRSLQSHGADADASHTETELVDVALAVMIEDGDVATWQALREVLNDTTDAIVRGRILGALARGRSDETSDLALGLTLDPALRVNEALWPLGTQTGVRETRERAWAWLEAHFDAIVERVSRVGASSLPWYAGGFCDEDHAAHVESFLSSRIESLSGGPRNLRAALEGIRLCAVRKTAQLPDIEAYFSALRP